MIIIHTPEEIEKIAAASRLTAETLSMLEKAVKPGMSTLDLDHLAENLSETEAVHLPRRDTKAIPDPSAHRSMTL